MMFELNCETDFVAKTELFGTLAPNISAAAKAAQPADRLALLSAEAVSAPGKTVQQLIDEAAASLKEKLELGRFARFDGGYIEATCTRATRHCRRPRARWSSSTPPTAT